MEKANHSSSEYYRSFVGPEDKYDVFSAVQFNLLTSLGLLENHRLLDIGCGSLRSGRLFIPYLQPERYFGIEPHEWLVEQGISNQIGRDMIGLKKPSFVYDENFSFSRFETKFDFLLAHSIFSHTTQSQLRQCLAEASKVMTTSSIFAATFVEGEKNYEGDKWSLWAEYRYDFIENAAHEHGLVCRKIDWPSPDFQKWILMVKPGNKADVTHVDKDVALLNVRNELKFCKEKLVKLECHPVIRLALQCNRLLKLCGFFVNPIMRKIKK